MVFQMKKGCGTSSFFRDDGCIVSLFHFRKCYFKRYLFRNPPDPVSEISSSRPAGFRLPAGGAAPGSPQGLLALDPPKGLVPLESHAAARLVGAVSFVLSRGFRWKTRWIPLKTPFLLGNTRGKLCGKCGQVCVFLFFPPGKEIHSIAPLLFFRRCYIMDSLSHAAAYCREGFCYQIIL